MRKLHEIAADLKNRLGDTFPTFRFSTAENSPQLLNEIRAVSDAKLPAVIAVIGSGEIIDSARHQVLKITLVMIDRFVAGSDERALSAWEGLQTLMDLFPADVSEINGVRYIPQQFYAASGDPKYACFAFELEAHQC